MAGGEVKRDTSLRETDVRFVVLQLQRWVEGFAQIKNFVGHLDCFRGSTIFPVAAVGGFEGFLIFINKPKTKGINDLREVKPDPVAYVDGRHLKGNDGDEPVEQPDDVKKTRCYVFCDQYTDVLVLGVATTLNVPILDGSDDVRFVGCAELQFRLVADEAINFFEEQVETTARRLSSLFVDERQIAKTKNRRIGCNNLLNPLLVEFRVVLEGNGFERNMFHGCTVGNGEVERESSADGKKRGFLTVGWSGQLGGVCLIIDFFRAE